MKTNNTSDKDKIIDEICTIEEFRDYRSDIEESYAEGRVNLVADAIKFCVSKNISGHDCFFVFINKDDLVKATTDGIRKIISTELEETFGKEEDFIKKHIVYDDDTRINAAGFFAELYVERLSEQDLFEMFDLIDEYNKFHDSDFFNVRKYEKRLKELQQQAFEIIIKKYDEEFDTIQSLIDKNPFGYSLIELLTSGLVRVDEDAMTEDFMRRNGWQRALLYLSSAGDYFVTKNKKYVIVPEIHEFDFYED